MHFYQKNIGDFNNATRHLTRVERSLFSDAIELYYDTEKPLTSDINKLNRLLLAHSQEEKDALLVVLAEFFTLTDEGYFNKRCNEEIVKYQAYMDSKSKAGKASAEQRAKQKATDVQQVFNTTSTKQNQEPITINHKTKTPKATATRLPADWLPNESDLDFCKTERPDLNPGRIANEFKDYWISVAGPKGVKADWSATWRNWVRRQTGIQAKPPNGKPMKGLGVISDEQFNDWLEGDANAGHGQKAILGNG
jgi:uncharacterized protein YdaU (DUF1376 family)